MNEEAIALDQISKKLGEDKPVINILPDIKEKKKCGRPAKKKPEVIEQPAPEPKKAQNKIAGPQKPPVWKINPDGTKTRLDHVPVFQPTHIALMWRGEELIKNYGYTPEQAIEQIKEEVQKGLIDLSPPPPGKARSNGPSNVQQAPVEQSKTLSDEEAAQKMAEFTQHYYAYLMAAVRLDAGQINGLPLEELEDIALLITKPVKPFPQWAQARYGVDYNGD